MVRATRDGPAGDRAFAVGYAGAAAGYVLMCLVANLMSQVVVSLYFAAFAGAAAALLGQRLLTVPTPSAPSRPTPMEVVA